ncbi:MAG TPA: hypothetical protein VN345_04115 [Blastocatellia bacterium]|nr:hypothetical protein [Blastocatellia bacterium]
MDKLVIVEGEEDEVQEASRSRLDYLRSFLKLPLQERRKLLAEDADRIAKLYEAEPDLAERERWQGGDIVDYWDEFSKMSLKK